MAQIHPQTQPSRIAPQVITFPDSLFRLHQTFPPAGDQPEAIDEADRRHRRRARVPDAARRNRLGQDLHDGERDRAHGPAGAGHGAQQDARRAALFRDPRVLSRERGRVLRLLLRLLPARSVRAVARPVHREGLEHQRAHRADAPVGDQVAARAARHDHRRHGVGDLRYRRPVRIPQHDPASAREREDRAARRDPAPDRDAVPAQRASNSGAASSACAAT